MKTIIPENIQERINIWLHGDFDIETKAAVKELIQKEDDEIIDAFYKDLEFGTGGLRGIMGVGTNRMNKYTVAMATQGLANYLKQEFPNQQIKLAIATDSRNNNKLFESITADVLSANGMQVYVFDDIRPTPELSFAIRYLKCQSGIMITASHNPKEYNGYKVYWEDGAQLVNPHDKNVIEEVRKITSIEQINFEAKKENIHIIGAEIDKNYIEQIKSLSLRPDIVARQKDLKIVFTPIHGTTYKIVPASLKAFGFSEPIHVPEQDIISGDFPTVFSPNPEEKTTLKMARDKTIETDAELIMATDPDGDRVGVAVKAAKGKYELLNGNQTAALLYYYMLGEWEKQGKLTAKEYTIKTIVTSELLKEISESFGVPSYDTLTGFKYIAEVIRKNEGKKQFIIGGEESYGYLAGEFVRDKDAVLATCLIAEMTAWAKDQGKSVIDILNEIYRKYGLYHERLHSLTKKGKKGADEIQEMMQNFRTNPPMEINASSVQLIKDYKLQLSKNFGEKKEERIDLPVSDVLQFFLKDGSKITMRPSGTEPKIKFYFSVNSAVLENENILNKRQLLDNKINEIIKDLGL
jgi:phosphoglucomutase